MKHQQVTPAGGRQTLADSLNLINQSHKNSWSRTQWVKSVCNFYEAAEPVRNISFETGAGFAVGVKQSEIFLAVLSR
jgi:hypothetical protein